MSANVEAAVAALTEKLGGKGFGGGSAKFQIEGEGGVIIDANGVRTGDDDADVTLIASGDVFQAILAGEQNPTTAFMTGKLRIEGNMGLAMQLASVLA